MLASRDITTFYHEKQLPHAKKRYSLLFGLLPVFDTCETKILATYLHTFEEPLFPKNL
jgi:hypothetical protein